MIVLGIDPGSLHTGYGVIRLEDQDVACIEYDVLHFNSRTDHVLRLKRIFEQITDVIERTRPDEAAVEMPIFGRNPQSMLKLGRAQAAASLAALLRQVPVSEYTPKEVKKAVTGNGNASKEQVWGMVRSTLGLVEDRGRDASDALAVALCHAHRQRPNVQSRKTGRSWASFVSANPSRIIG